MKSFTCTIRDKEGLHARPAGLLAAAAKKYAGTNVTIAKGDKSGDAKKIFKIMSLAVKCGDSVTITADGPDEDAALAETRAVLEGAADPKPSPAGK